MKKLSLLLIIALFLVGCEEEKNNTPANNAEQVEEHDFSAEEAVSPEVANDLVAAYCEFADANPNDSMAPEYLFMAVDVLMNFDEPQRTIAIIDRLINDYPDYDKTQFAFFLKGFIFEERYRDLDKAKQIYEQYLELYPNGDFADDCRASIENLGLSPEELVRKFEAME